MSGKELFDFIYSLGYSDYCHDTNLQDSLKPAAKSLDWLFAFPKMSRFLNWVLKECPKHQLIHYKDVKSYQNLPLKISLDRIQELENLLEPEIIEVDDSFSQEAVNKELEAIIHDQESQIKALEAELSLEESEIIDLSNEESALESTNQELEHDILQYLESFSDICPVVSLQSVQNFLKVDEELTQNLINYSNMIDMCIGAIDGSVFQRCLMSDRGPEFTALCLEKRSLEETHFDNYLQMLLASSTLEKTRTALKTFEKTLTSPSNIEKADIDKLTASKASELELVNTELASTLTKIKETNSALKAINSDDLQYENLEISVKKKDFALLKQAEVQKMLNSQKGFNLLALASIITEMKEFQGEYDKLFTIQSFFEEFLAQAEFRLPYYQKYKIRAEILSDEMKTIDERNEFFTSVAKILGVNARSTFDEIFAAAAKAKDLEELKIKMRSENLKSFAGQAKNLIFKLSCIRNEVREKVMTRENIEESQIIVESIKELEEKLLLFVEKYELMNKEVIVGELGITERDIFVEYLLEKKPLFFEECKF